MQIVNVILEFNITRKNNNHSETILRYYITLIYLIDIYLHVF